jgi:predicted transcriptional regulator
MITDGTAKQDFTYMIKEILAKEPGLSVKDLAGRLKTNRQFMAGVLRVLEEQGKVTFRQVGPARIYFPNSSKGKSSGVK